MSRRQQQEMQALALRVAMEAADRERTRCIWCLQQILLKAEQGAAKKLMTPAEEAVAKTRLELTRAIVRAAQTLIYSNARPKTEAEKAGEN